MAHLARTLHRRTAAEGKEGKCYDEDPANCAKYGRLYDWETAKTICPQGWHLLTKNELQALGESGISENDFSNLFSLLGGYGNCSNSEDVDSWNEIESTGYWWTSEEGTNERALCFFYPMGDAPNPLTYLPQSCLASVRCVKN
jgi:hypothetical protein